MRTEIYYFTSTGNSLVVARELAESTNGTLISIRSVMGAKRIRADADVMGIVFPVYYASLGGSGIPLIVERFVGKLEAIGSNYLFAVCTHSGGPGDTIENLSKLVQSRGASLLRDSGCRRAFPIPRAPRSSMRYSITN